MLWFILAVAVFGGLAQVAWQAEQKKRRRRSATPEELPAAGVRVTLEVEGGRRVASIHRDSFDVDDELFTVAGHSPDGRLTLGLSSSTMGENVHVYERPGAAVVVELGAARVLWLRRFKEPSAGAVSDDGAAVIFDAFPGVTRETGGHLLGFGPGAAALWRQKIPAYAESIRYRGSERVEVRLHGCDVDAFSNAELVLSAATGEILSNSNAEDGDDDGPVPHGRVPVDEAFRAEQQLWDVRRAVIARRWGDVERVLGELPPIDKLPGALQAKVWRFRGELAIDRDGDVNEAIAAWERAIALDPKVGVKRKLDALKKKR